MLKKFITGLSTIMPFLTLYPMWVRIIVGIWVCLTIVLILSLLLFRVPQKKQLESSTLSLKTPLYEKTKLKVDDFYVDIDRNKLTPWAFLNSGKPFEVKDYYGKSISYEGVRFEGSPRTVFWGNFIEPFLEHGIINILEQVANEAKENSLAPEPCINEAVGFLDGCISKVYNRMAKIDQNLRGKGYPKSVNRKDVSQEVDKMISYLQEQQKSRIKIANLQFSQIQKEKSHQKTSMLIMKWGLIIAILGLIFTVIMGIPSWIPYLRKFGN